MSSTSKVAAEIERSLTGQPCWYVLCGGCTYPSVKLALGERKRRVIPLKNPAVTDEYREFEGEIGLLVWCPWRLDLPESTLTSSTDTEGSATQELAGLCGQKIESAHVSVPGWDLDLRFSNGISFRAFSNYFGAQAFSTNWEVWYRDHAVLVKAGCRPVVENREPHWE
jgi:hypothetical protein